MNDTFNSSILLLEHEAALEHIIETAAKYTFDTVHFTCHASFNLEIPSQSGLLLADDRTLSINDIMLRLRLSGHPLVTLSACQTAQARIR